MQDENDLPTNEDDFENNYCEWVIVDGMPF